MNRYIGIDLGAPAGTWVLAADAGRVIEISVEPGGFGRYIKIAAEETADLGTALVAYADARQHHIDTETVMFERLAAADIDLSVFGVSGE